MTDTAIQEDVAETINRIQDKRDIDHLDLEGFAEYYQGELSTGTLIQYLRYLAHMDFPLDSDRGLAFKIDDETAPTFLQWARTKARQRFGTGDEERNSRSRFIYFCYTALKKYLRMRYRSDLIDVLPDEESVQNPSSEPQTLTCSQNQVQKMIEAAEDTKDELAIACLYYAGLRSYELLQMHPEWITLHDDCVEISIPGEYAKGNKSNVGDECTFLPLRFKDRLEDLIETRHNYLLEDSEQDRSLDELIDAVEDSETSCVFVYHPGHESVAVREKDYHFLSRERHYLTRMLQETAANADIATADELTPHVLRRSYIQHVYKNTRDLSRTAALARHDSPDTTNRFYLNKTKRENQEAYKEIFKQ